MRAQACYIISCLPIVQVYYIASRCEGTCHCHKKKSGQVTCFAPMATAAAGSLAPLSAYAYYSCTYVLSFNCNACICIYMHTNIIFKCFHEFEHNYNINMHQLSMRISVEHTSRKIKIIMINCNKKKKTNQRIHHCQPHDQD
jgi:hypothetical protein